MSARLAEQIADAVLYEGYVLYPYRASAVKNRLRWQMGLVVPRDFADSTEADPWFAQTECLVDVGSSAALTIHARALHVQERAIEEGAAGAGWQRVDGLVVAGEPLVPWDEAVACEFRQAIAIGPTAAEWCWPWTLAAHCDVQELDDRMGTRARIVRARREVNAIVRVSAEPCGPLVKLRLRIENLTVSGVQTLAGREAVLRLSLAGTHVILAIDGGAFVSLLDPPAQVASLVAGCVNLHTFPVLVGPQGSSSVMLSSPIILYDYPAVAPESHGDLFDGTEIDELLTLRVRTLTPDEKREARATDPRAAQIIDRCDAATPESIARLHGAVRSFETLLNPPDQPAPEEASIEVRGVRIRRGDRVQLQPERIADSLDICLTGRLATVAAVYHTIEDDAYVAVTLDDDPFAHEGLKYRRALFFRPHELLAVARGAA